MCDHERPGSTLSRFADSYHPDPPHKELNTCMSGENGTVQLFCYFVHVCTQLFDLSSDVHFYE